MVIDVSSLLVDNRRMESGYKKVLKVFSTRIGISSPFIIVDCSMISYPNYKFCFPIKALGMYSHLYGDEEL
jgi:hypothetical protein